MGDGPDAEARSWRVWALASLLTFALVLGVTWRFYDADEFVNLQQAVRANEGLALYHETPSNHPPLYTDVLRLVVALPGDDLAAARILSLIFTAGAGLVFADLYRQAGRPTSARIFLALWTLNAFVAVAGTRAMNESLLLLLLAVGFWSTTHAAPWAPAALGLAPWTRFTGLFFLPPLLALRLRVRHVIAAALAFLAVGLAHTLADPAFLPALYRQAVVFHAQRPPEDFGRRFLKVLGYGGFLVVLLCVRLTPSLRDRTRPYVRVGMLALAGAAALLVLPTVHVHYLLPMAAVACAATVEAVEGSPQRRRRALVVAVAIVAGLAQAGLYVPMTPQPDLVKAHQTAAVIEASTPPGVPILTDAPELALLAHRTNLDGYYWSWSNQTGPDTWTHWASTASVIVVSYRFGHLDRGFPPAFLQALSSVPCRDESMARIYWTGSTGPAPPDFVSGCG